MDGDGSSEAPKRDRIQLCGRLAIAVDDRRVDESLKTTEERLLFTYLVLNRLSPLDAGELVAALWPEQAPPKAADRVNRLLRRLRRVLGDRLELQPNLQLRLPVGSFVDIEVAAEAVHRAEAAVARLDWGTSWPAARVALHTARRPFLPGARAPWIEAQRRRLRDLELRAHECIAATGLGLGGNELLSAERSARVLIEREPLRENGYRHLIVALARRRNVAEALQAYAELTRRLDEIGIGPSPEMQALRDELTRGTPRVPQGAGAVETTTRTFMFTDICESTSLVTTIGDQAWRQLMEWHDRLTAEVIKKHRGEILDRAGDGLFAAFDSAIDAAGCAVTLQRRLAAHRTEHGFAPLLRIGVHTDQAVPAGGKYVGRGVHLAARVSAVAGPGEIVLTTSTAMLANASLEQPRHVPLKGLSEPVEVGLLRWD